MTDGGGTKEPRLAAKLTAKLTVTWRLIVLDNGKAFRYFSYPETSRYPLGIKRPGTSLDPLVSFRPETTLYPLVNYIPGTSLDPLVSNRTVTTLYPLVNNRLEIR